MTKGGGSFKFVMHSEQGLIEARALQDPYTGWAKKVSLITCATTSSTAS